ncbi:hypothetical protein B0H10DRAFT_2000261 [Mycena sp. CBHHK59/15]|nr:hypothetical protein B0H10DRAFT_2000261 [Mycena sp. CBHHK59/15]
MPPSQETKTCQTCGKSFKLQGIAHDAAYAQLNQPKARRNATASSLRAQSVRIPVRDSSCKH